VVPSPPIRKALRRLDAPAPDGILAVGTVFTEEALELLAAAGARPIAFRKAKWTDESARARQL
jgi:2-keto-3-deoxy-6-phosphogluconate aldolase